MKKITLICALICMTAVLSAQSITTNWTFTNDGGNPPLSPLDASNLLPLPPTPGSTRNIAVGNFNGNDRFILFTRAGGLQVLTYETENGTYAASLNVTGVIGGTLPIGDGDVTEDGKLLMSNLARNGEEFKVYKWENETDAPEVVISYITPAGVRYGDKVYMTGNYTTGTAKVYAPNKALGYSKIMCWGMIPDPENPSAFIFDNTPIETIEVFGNSTQPTVCTTSDGNYYFKDSEQNLCKYSAEGDSIGEASNSLIRSWGTAVRFICKDGADDIIAYFKYRSKALDPEEPLQENVDILRVPGGDLSMASVIVTTPSLGSQYNLNGWGDIIVRKVGDNAEVFVLSATNGIGKFTIDNFLSVSSTNDIDNKIKLISNDGHVNIEGVVVSNIEVYNSLGQLVLQNSNSNIISSNGLHGLHLIKVKAENNLTRIFKLVF